MRSELREPFEPIPPISTNAFKPIAQGIKKRHVDGNASSPHAADAVARLIPLARAAWAEAQYAGANA